MSIDWHIEIHDSVESTQDMAKAMAESGAPEGVVVQALEQTGGYGRHGREWVSERGNLYLSILLRPKCAVQDIGQLSLLAGLAVGQTIRSFLPEPEALRLKWPNDALISGQKCAGLILETGLDDAGKALKWVILGVGINIVSAPSEIGTSISEHCEKAPGVNRLGDTLRKTITTLYGGWAAQGFEPVRKAWLDMAHKKGEAVTVKIGEQVQAGKFHGIDEHGALLIHDEQFRVHKITSGDVFL